MMASNWCRSHGKPPKQPTIAEPRSCWSSTGSRRSFRRRSARAAPTERLGVTRASQSRVATPTRPGARLWPWRRGSAAPPATAAAAVNNGFTSTVQHVRGDSRGIAGVPDAPDCDSLYDLLGGHRWTTAVVDRPGEVGAVTHEDSRW